MELNFGSVSSFIEKVYSGQTKKFQPKNKPTIEKHRMKITIQYGPEQSQFGELYMPKGNPLGVICLLHGGFWTMPYGLDQFNDVAQALAAMGYCVWNIEYRRIGEPNYAWPQTLDDAKDAVNKLIDIGKAYAIDVKDVVVVGHSAGGHLAIWLNTQDLKISIKRYVGLAPILDLETAHYAHSGNGAVEKLIQGRPDEFPGRYLNSSPGKLTRRNNYELIIHGEKDEYIPLQWSRLYYESVKKFTSNTHLIELDDCGHMDFIDPDSHAFEILKSNLKENPKIEL